MMPYLLWEQGYFKALLDIYNLIERSQSKFKIFENKQCRTYIKDN